jgi:hypothetical protein
MRRALRRGFAAIACAALAAGTLAVLTATPAAADDNFYQPPSPLPAGHNGDVIKSQPVTFSGATGTRIMYLSRDTHDQAIPVTGLVLVPTTPWSGPGQRPVVAYAPFTAGMGDQCAPSKTLVGEGQSDFVSGFQGSFVNALLGKGFAVAETDYQGLGTPGEHTYVIRKAEGHAVLDVLRAAQRLPGTGLPASGPLGIAGYSEGGDGAAAAAELASSYAPELDIRGAYAGAVPADKAVLAKSLDGGMYVGFLGYSLIGINEAYPDSGMLNLANAAGAQLFLEARTTCTMDAVFKYMFKNTGSLTKDGRPVADYLSQPPFNAIVAENRVGTLKPSMPVLVEHTPLDDVIPYAVGVQLGKDWCGQGATVQFRQITSFTPFLSHALGMMTASGDAASFLADQFAGKAATSNCGQF